VEKKCSNCGYTENRTIHKSEVSRVQQEVATGRCPNCSSQALTMNEPKDIIDELAELADQAGASAEVISSQTEEGVMLIKSFGGIAATLKYPM